MRRALALLAILLVACSRQPANPEVDAAVRALDLRIAELEQWRDQLAPEIPEIQKDFRGRTLHDDLDRWVLSPDARREIKGLRDRAAASRYIADAQQLLAQAGKRATDEAARGRSVWSYWNAHLPAPYWRRYWHELFAANSVPDEPPDSMLVAIEERLTRSLNSGDFATAGKEADELIDVFGESLDRASGRIFRAAGSEPVFQLRKTACPNERIAPRGEKAILIRGESIESFYPPDAIKRGEQGSVVLRAQVNAAGCATAVAVRVHSGVPALDTAALSWFETAGFTPASRQGTPVDSVFTWKVRFQLRDGAQ